jgi:hypothetical protein
LGYGKVENVTSALIDCFCGSGFAPEYRLSRGRHDDRFGVPVVATVEAMTAALSEELRAVFRALPPAGGPPVGAGCGQCCRRFRRSPAALDDEAATDLAILRTLTTLPGGPCPAPPAALPVARSVRRGLAPGAQPNGADGAVFPTSFDEPGPARLRRHGRSLCDGS